MQKMQEKCKLYQHGNWEILELAALQHKFFWISSGESSFLWADAVGTWLLTRPWCIHQPCPFQCSQLYFHFRDAKEKKSYVAESSVLWIQAAHLRQGYLFPLNHISTVSPLHSRTHTHTHTCTHRCLSELTLLDTVGHWEVFKKPSPNN